MSSMAKIFVVVNLILAVCVFGSAAVLLGAQDDYKVASQDLKQKFDDYKAAKDKELQARELEASQALTKAGEAVAEKTTAKAETETYRTQLEGANNANAKMQASIDSYAQSLEGLRAQLDSAASAVQKATADAAAASKNEIDWKNKFQGEAENRARLEVELSGLQDQVQELSAAKGDLERMVRQQKLELGEYAKKFGGLISDNRGSDGRVLAVRQLNNGVLVSISVGKEDGVRGGDTYNIRRGANYIGTIRIDRVMKGQAIGIFNSQYTGGNGNPDVGDVAYVSR